MVIPVTDVTDEEWAFVAPYLTLLREDAGQREYALRDAFDALRWVIKTGARWRFLPHDFPPWWAVYQQARRWLVAGRFEDMAHDRRERLRIAGGRNPSPSAVIPDGRALPSTPESGARAEFDGYEMRNGPKIHIAVDTLGHLPALCATAGKDQERAQVAGLAAAQEATGQTVTLAGADQGYAGDQPAADTAALGITLQVVQHDEVKKGFVLLPRRWVVERSFARMGRFRRPARDSERPTKTLAGWHWVAFLALLLHRWTQLTTQVHNRL